MLSLLLSIISGSSSVCASAVSYLTRYILHLRGLLPTLNLVFTPVLSDLFYFFLLRVSRSRYYFMPSSAWQLGLNQCSTLLDSLTAKTERIN